ncbi:MAG: hypothetical protein J6D21_01575 [Clostridia bacterium]|nr:hypothetical protein [Clostridia bacterium]
MRKIICIITAFLVMVMLFVFPSSAAEPTYTNLADPSSEDWHSGRLTSSGSLNTSVSGYLTTNYIPVSKGDVVRISGLDFTVANNRLVFYDESFNSVSNTYFMNGSSSVAQIGLVNGILDYAELVVSSSAVSYVRFSGGWESSEVIITVNEEIFPSDEVVEDPTISVQIHGTRSQRLKDYIADVESGSMSGIRHTMSESVEHVFTDVFPTWANAALWISDRIKPDLFVYLCVMVIIFSIVGGYKYGKNE